VPQNRRAAAELRLLSDAPLREEFRTALAKWFAAHGRDLPWRHTRDPYAIMVSEFMLQQTQVATVIPYYNRWMERFPSFSALAQAREDAVLAEWQGLGYYSRARNLRRAAQQVVAEFGGALPADFTAIAKLPGVGRYTVGAICSFAFDQPVVTIDANIARVIARLIDLQLAVDGSAGTDALSVAAEALLPKSGGSLHTSSLMELGALLCTPAKPQCLICPVRPYCAAKEPHLLPRKKPRRALVALEESCALITDGPRVLLEQQIGKRWRGLWKLPVLTPSDAAAAAAAPLLQLSYPFTHHRVALSVFAAAPPAVLSAEQQWFSSASSELPAMPSPHRRAVLALC
jgi:A/G-specific adenine glycosylase